MSIPKKQIVPCPHCHKEFPVTIWDSVNTDLSPDLPERIINGEFFNAECPYCGFVARLRYNVLYHDMRHSVMVWVVHKTEDYGKQRAEIMGTCLFPGYRSRIVHGINELREKVAALESGKDDRVIELCKHYIAYTAQQQDPSFHVSNVFYTLVNGIDMVSLYGKDGRELSCELEPAMYNMITEFFTEKLKCNPEEPGGVYDSAWAAAMFSGGPPIEPDAPAACPEPAAPPPPQKLFCHHCGAKVPVDSIFCYKCGTRLYRGTNR